MQQSDSSKVGYRRAALALHRLHEQDRQWLLGRLPDAERGEVLASLTELDRMQPRMTEADIDRLLEPGAEEAVVAPVADDPWHTLDRAPVHAVLHVLRGEPDRLIAIVCALRKWRWSAELMTLLGEARAASVAQMMRNERMPAAAVCDAVVASVTGRVTAGEQSAGFEGALETAAGPKRAVNGRRSWRGLFGWRP